MAGIPWAENAIVSIKLRDDLYTLGLLKISPYMWFFDIRNDSGDWHNVDLNKAAPLFCVQVARVVLQRLVAARVRDKTVIPPDALPIPPNWITPNMNVGPGRTGTFAWRGGKLVQLQPGPDSLNSPVIKPRLDVLSDKDAIESCELTNMWGDQDLGDRLRRYFDTGINRDDLKFEIFPGLWDDREKLRPLTRRLPEPLR
jgi:hypothetical protein